MRQLHRRGQIGLLLLIVMGVVVSIVMSIASRVITDTSLSRQERENNASFSIAESGVEQALRILAEGTTDVSGQPISDSSGLINGTYGINKNDSFELYVKEGETAQIDLTGTPSNVVVRWGKTGEDPGACTEGSGGAPAALEVAITNASNVVLRSYYNANRCSSMGGTNNFATANGVSGSYANNQTISFAGAQKFMRIKPLYNGVTINVTGSNLASQLYLIQSHAASSDARTDIAVTRTLDTPASVFDFALFSNTTIIQN